MINEALCSENCIARFSWQTGELDSSNGLYVKWDEQNVNTCPENFQWKAGHSYILVESPGLYEFSLAFFASTKKGKKTTLQLLVNDEVVATHHQSGSYTTGSSV